MENLLFAADHVPNVLFPERIRLDESEIQTLPEDMRGVLVDLDTKIEFYEAAKLTRESHLIRARVIDTFHRRYRRYPQKAKKYSMYLIEIAHGDIAESTKTGWLSGYKNLGSLLNNNDLGQTLYDKLLGTGWNCSAVVKNPRMTHDQYMLAADNWDKASPAEKKGEVDPAVIRRLAGIERKTPPPKDVESSSPVIPSLSRMNEKKKRTVKPTLRFEMSSSNIIPLRVELPKEIKREVSVKQVEQKGNSVVESEEESSEEPERIVRPRKRKAPEANDEEDSTAKRRRVYLSMEVMERTMGKTLALARMHEDIALISDVRTLAKECNIKI